MEGLSSPENFQASPEGFSERQYPDLLSSIELANGLPRCATKYPPMVRILYQVYKSTIFRRYTLKSRLYYQFLDVSFLKMVQFERCSFNKISVIREEYTISKAVADSAYEEEIKRLAFVHGVFISAFKAFGYLSTQTHSFGSQYYL